MSGPTEEVERVLDLAAELTAGTPRADEVVRLRAGLDGPLRVAIAGRVKAGKSTLLNALVGERLAATDAGECTKVVTRYQDGVSYDVQAVGLDGAEHPLVFRRLDGVLSIDLDGFTPESLSRIDITWPSKALATMTLIDTPGLASLDDRNSLRSREFLAMGEDRPSDADAVIYLMRHLHRRDAEFLGAFLDRSVTATSPVNALAVLSRADEIGAGRLDAMDSARRIAERYRHDPDVRALCTTVVAVAGLLAETGLTWREDEAAAVRALAATDDAVRERMLWSAEGFCDPGSSDLTVELRRSLLGRLGLFGLRLLVDAVRNDRATTAVDMARVLVDASGLTELREVVEQVFLPQAQVLKARTALVGLRALARQLDAEGHPDARRLDQEVERLEASRPEFGQLRLVHLVRSGTAEFTPDETSELEQVVASDDAAVRLGIAPGGGADDVRRSALAAIERWRTRAAAPLNDPARTEACESMARIYESIYAGA